MFLLPYIYARPCHPPSCRVQAVHTRRTKAIHTFWWLPDCVYDCWYREIVKCKRSKNDMLVNALRLSVVQCHAP
eukprot:scaffold30643_cov35-Tisochrysis_lutea.AAC.6